MAVGDGSAWDETLPDNNVLASQEDDYQRDLRVGVRSRMALEHEWPVSQSATNQAGVHKFITLQNQAAKPTISGTQLAAVYSKTVGAGLQEMFFENELGNEVQITSRTGLTVPVVTSAALAKAWLYFNPSTATGSFSPIVGYNISGMSKTGTGAWIVTFVNTFTAANYACIGNAGNGAIGASGNFSVHMFALATGSCAVGISNSVDSPADNPTIASIVWYGL